MKTISGNIRYCAFPELHFAARNSKFSNEKVSFENGDYVVVFDGVILNSTSLFKKFCCCDNAELLLSLFNHYGTEMVMYTKGSYALSIWDKKQNKVFITNDLLSKRAIYYHVSDSGVCFAGSYYDLLDLLAPTGYIPKTNISAVEAMSSQGYLKGNETYLKDVFYLNAFESIVVDLKSNASEVIKHKPKKTPVPQNEDEVIDKFDALFTNAVKLQFEKNKEYGYQQASTISGGMDSRACLLKGINVGYKNDIVCFSYAQSNSLDFQISQQIAIDYGLDYLFYPMDSAVFIPRHKETMNRNECQQRSVGSTAAAKMADLLNTNNFGIIHTGLLGGELLGDIISTTGNVNKQAEAFHKAINILLGTKINPDTISYDFSALLDQLRACQNFSYMFLHCCEVFSPFLDEDLFMFVSQLESSLLYGRKLYIKWMRKYIPNPYVLTHSCCPADAAPLKIVVTKAFYAVQRKLTGKSTREMNPFDFWFNNSLEFKKGFTEEFETLCQFLNACESTKEVVEIGRACWGENWMKNACVLTAFYGVKNTYQKFGKKKTE